MVLRTPTNSLIERSGIPFSEATTPSAVDTTLPSSVILRSPEKEGANYLEFFLPNRRIVFDQFIVANWQKNIDEVVVPNYTRGQPVIETFGRGRTLINVTMSLVDAAITVYTGSTPARGYVGSSIREFVRQYDRYFRGSASVEHDAYSALTIKGRRDYGYVTQLAFDRTSLNDIDVKATFTFWSFEQDDNHEGQELAEKLIDETSIFGGLSSE